MFDLDARLYLEKTLSNAGPSFKSYSVAHAQEGIRVLGLELKKLKLDKT